MSIIAVVGDGATTTAVALTAAWPADQLAVCLEADPRGGVLAAWLDLTRSGGGLSQAAALPSPTWPQIELLIQTSPTGVRALTAPVRAIEAAASIGEVSHRVVPILSMLHSPVFLADCGRAHLGAGLPAVVTQASIAVVPVLQHQRSARAAAVHVERLAELCDALAARAIPIVLAVIGARPYSADEIASFVAGRGEHVATVDLAVDDWSAAVLAGRTGSSRRLKRAALMRSAAGASALLSATLVSIQRPAPVWGAPR